MVSLYVLIHPRPMGGPKNLKTSIIHMTLDCRLSFCYKSRCNRKTWPLYWLATQGETQKEKDLREKAKQTCRGRQNIEKLTANKN